MVHRRPTTAPLAGALHYIKKSTPAFVPIHLALTTRSSWQVVEGVPHVPGCPGTLGYEHETLGTTQSLHLQDVWGRTCVECTDVLEYLLGVSYAQVAGIAIELYQAHMLPGERYLVHMSTRIDRAVDAMLGHDLNALPDQESFDLAARKEAENLLDVDLEAKLRNNPLHHFHEHAALQVTRAYLPDLSSARDEDQREALRDKKSMLHHWHEAQIDPRINALEAYQGSHGGRSGSDAEALHQECTQEFEQELQRNLADTAPVLLAMEQGWWEVLNPPLQEILGALSRHEKGWMYLTGTPTIWKYLQRKFQGEAYALGTVEDSDTPAILETAWTLIRDSGRSDLQEYGQALAAARMLNP